MGRRRVVGWLALRWLALGCLALAACAEQGHPVSPQEAVALVRSGQPLLSCHEPCLAAWQSAAPQAAQLDAARRWAELAAKVVGAGYQDDLTLYYLGRAAEGLGFPGAAAGYYRQSTNLSGGLAACQKLSGVCGGVALPKAAVLRLAAIDRELARQRYRRSRPAALPQGAPEAEIPPDALTGAAIDLTAPAMPAAPPPVPPTPPAGRVDAADRDYIEPPPAGH